MDAPVSHCSICTLLQSVATIVARTATLVCVRVIWKIAATSLSTWTLQNIDLVYKADNVVPS